MSRPVRVAVLMGGQSSEHEVALSSAGTIVPALEATGHEVLSVLITRAGLWTIDGAPVVLGRGADDRAVFVALDGPDRWQADVVFPVLHGPNGEDGTVQGVLECAGIPYVGGGVAASALAMDKVLFKGVLATAGIPCTDYVVVEADEWAADPAAVRARVAQGVGYPAFAKPSRLGSSVGVSPVPDPAALDAALDLALHHDSKALVERAVVGGRELEVGILDGDEPVVSPPGEVVFAGGWYDYSTKYDAGMMELRVPADIPAEAAAQMRELALRAFRAVECEGLTRADFFLCADGTILLSELNTMPGFTPTSAYPALMLAAGIDRPEVVSRLVALALERAERRRAFVG